MATRPNAGHVTGPLVEKAGFEPKPSGSPVPAVVLACLRPDETVAVVAGFVDGGGVDDALVVPLQRVFFGKSRPAD